MNSGHKNIWMVALMVLASLVPLGMGMMGGGMMGKEKEPMMQPGQGMQGMDMAACHQMMQSMMGGGMGMMGMMGPMSPEQKVIARLEADIAVKEAQLRRLLLDDDVKPDILRTRVLDIHTLQADLQTRKMLTMRSAMSGAQASPPQSPPAQPGGGYDSHH